MSQHLEQTHPSFTADGKMKIQRISTGLVYERYPPDARDLVNSGLYTFVARSVTSVRETLGAKTVAELQALRAQTGITTHGRDADRAWLIDHLIPLIERGVVTLS